MAKKKEETAKPEDEIKLDENDKPVNEGKKTAKQAIKYALCTASAGLIQFVSFTIMTYAFADLNWGKITFIQEMDVTLFVATTVALALSVLWNFTLNRKFTFKSAKNVPIAMALAFLFYVPFYPFQTWYVYAVSTAIGGQEWAKLIAEGTVMLINGVLEFCWQKFVIYGKDQDTAVEKKVEEVGPNGEITVAPEEFTGDEMYDMISHGVDINDKKQVAKWKKHNH